MDNLLCMFPPNRIRELRKAAGLSQTALGARVGLTAGQVGHLENGARNLSIEWLRRIAAALEVSAADLLVASDNPDRLTDEERRIIEAIRRAPKQARHYIMPIVFAITDDAPAGDSDAA